MTCPYESFEDDGPLNTIYKKVFSVEIAQLDDVKEDDNNNPSNGSPFVSNIATAAFPTGEQQLRKEAVRKRRHNVRRIRIFFLVSGMKRSSAPKPSSHARVGKE